MVVCHNCGAPILYIITGSGETVACDDIDTEVITERGRIVHGHLRHVCKEDSQWMQNRKFQAELIRRQCGVK